MKLLRGIFDRAAPHFNKGGKFQKLYPVFEVVESFFFTSDEVTAGSCHVRDAIDLKRMMSVVLVALLPCVVMGMYNTGFQTNTALHDSGIVEQADVLAEVTGWRGGVLESIGLGFDKKSILDCLIHGALYFLPIYIVTMIVGIAWEMLFAVVRGHEINEGFFVTGLLIPLIMPANIPLWQVAMATSFAVVVAKEIFGGTGRNFLNPALVARAFVFFAYAKSISGDMNVWTAGNWKQAAEKFGVDALSGATPLAEAAEKGMAGLTEAFQPMDAFIGTIPGSIGETSTLACLIGAAILLLAGVGSWRIMVSMLAGTVALAAVFSAVKGAPNPMFEMTPGWHLLLGGFAFGLVFMATDPVSAAMTRGGQYIYGALIGVLVVVVRVLNIGFPEGTMLAILFGNAFAPLIDYYVVRANIKRRALRNG